MAVVSNPMPPVLCVNLRGVLYLRTVDPCRTVRLYGETISTIREQPLSLEETTHDLADPHGSNSKSLARSSKDRPPSISYTRDPERLGSELNGPDLLGCLSGSYAHFAFRMRREKTPVSPRQAQPISRLVDTLSKNRWQLEPVVWLSTAGNSTASALLWRQIDRQPTVSLAARSSP